MKSTLEFEVRVGYVDVYDEGELLKETFDLVTTPSAFYVANGNAYIIPWK